VNSIQGKITEQTNALKMWQNSSAGNYTNKTKLLAQGN